MMVIFLQPVPTQGSLTQDQRVGQATERDSSTKKIMRHWGGGGAGADLEKNLTWFKHINNNYVWRPVRYMVIFRF